jgi:hypothetical protein
MLCETLNIAALSVQTRALAMVRALHERHGIEYRYGEWRSMLRMFAADEPG